MGDLAKVASVVSPKPDLTNIPSWAGLGKVIDIDSILDGASDLHCLIGPQNQIHLNPRDATGWLQRFRST
jgi:hypothetical protein